MTRVIIRFKDGEHINIQGDYIDIKDEWIFAWKGDFIVLIVKAEEVVACYISEKKE